MRFLGPYRPHVRGLLVLGLPLVGSHLAQVAIGATDALMLGWYDVKALAAITLAHSLWFVIFIVGSGFAFVVLPLVAAAIGAGDDTQVRRVTRMAAWLSVIYGTLMIPPLVWSEPLFLALGQAPETAALANSYLSITAFAMIPALLVMVLKSYFAALERSRPVLWITVGAALVNAGLNWVLIFGKLGFPELGLTGAAVASFGAQVIALLAFAAHSSLSTPEHALFARFWRIDREAFDRVLRLGWPVGLTNLAESGLFAASALLMGWLGALPLAAHGVVLQLASLTFVVHLGLSQAAIVRTGAAYGRRDAAGLRLGAKAAVGISVSFSALAIVAYLVFPEQLVGMFVDPNDPARPRIIEIGVGLLSVAALFQLVDGMQVVVLGLLRGMQDIRRPMVIAAFSYWLLGIPASYAMGFGLDWGPVGVWLGLVVGLGAAAGALLVRFRGRAAHLGAAAPA